MERKWIGSRQRSLPNIIALRPREKNFGFFLREKKKKRKIILAVDFGDRTCKERAGRQNKNISLNAGVLLKILFAYSESAVESVFCVN